MQNFANREVCNLIVKDFKTQQPILHCDYANTNTTELTGTNVFAYGGWGHPKRIGFSGEKEGTFSFTTQLQSFQLWSVLTGGTVDSKADIVKREVIKCTTGGSLTLTLGTPVAGTVNAFAAEDDGGTPIVGEVSGTTFTATEASDIVADQSYVVYYTVASTEGVHRINIKNTTFPVAVTIQGESYEKGEDESILPYYLVVYKAQPQPNLTLGNSNTGDPNELTCTFDLMADANGDMLDLILIEE